MATFPGRPAVMRRESVQARLALLCMLAVSCTAMAATPCTSLGLAKANGMVLQIREAAQGERTAAVYRDADRRTWFVPLQGRGIAEGNADRVSCSFEGTDYWRLAATDPALSYDSDNDLLTFLDTSQVTNVIDGRKAQAMPQGETLNSFGINYQLALNYSDSGMPARLNPSTYADIYGRAGGWYFSNTVGWASYGRVARYESYALKEWLGTGTFLRLGDAVSSPTALGEALQFAGVSWGTDRNLRPGDFAPVLPNVRSGNTLAGPLEVFINDNLQFQQTLQNGVYDLRNLPAQLGFNSYSVRTTDAQGNPVTVQREIYLPSSLLPQGIKSWRLDAGFQREDFFTANAHYGAPFVSGDYAVGLSNDVTVGVQGLVSKQASTFAAGYDQRLGALWTGHAGLLAARNGSKNGEALQLRLDGGGRWWRLLADWTRAFRPLPGLGARAALVSQKLLQAQWNGFTDWNIGLTAVQSQREQASREDVATLSATTRVTDSGASLSMALTHIRSVSGKQDNVMLSLFVPLAPLANGRNQSVFASQSNASDVNLTRAQYSNSGRGPEDGSWNVGVTEDSRKVLSSIDGSWSGSTQRTDLMASARSGQAGSDAQLSLRSGLLWAGGGVYATRPINGAFAMVSTGAPGVGVFYENRPMGRSDERGMLLVPDLRPLEPNRLTVDPSTWPIHWTASETERQVIPPRGGGVLVSFRINASVWPKESLVTPLTADGRHYPSGTVVRAQVDSETRETVIDRQGQLWIAELLPATVFTITHSGKRCEFSMPAPDNTTPDTSVKPTQCQEAS